MMINQSNLISSSERLVSTLKSEMVGKSSSSASFAISSPLLFIKPTFSKALQNFKPFIHLHHFEPLQFHKHFKALTHFRPLKHLKHFKPFKHVNGYLLSGITFAYLTASSINEARKSFADMNQAKQNLVILKIVEAHVKAPDEIKTIRTHFTNQLDSAKKDLAIRIGLVAVGIIGMVGSVLNAPAILLLATGASALLTGISIIKSISDYSREGSNQAKSARMIADLQAMQKSDEIALQTSDEMDYDSFENTDYDGTPLHTVTKENGQQEFFSSNPGTYYLHQEPTNN